MNNFAAVIFDLDGVVTDTAELHYQAWSQLAADLNIAFDRELGDQFRGVGRAQCLELLLAGRQVTNVEELLQRKNDYYVKLLSGLSSNDLLPGVTELLAELRASGIKTAIGSVSKNAVTVLEALGVSKLFDVIVDGTMLTRSKPDPEVFAIAAQLLSISPGRCVVLEDAAAGIESALAAGMWAVGLGPMERVGQAHATIPSLEGVDLARLSSLIDDGSWVIRCLGDNNQNHLETIFTIGNGHLSLRGSTEESCPGENAASFMHGVWDDMPVSRTELVNLPKWWGLDLWVNGVRFHRDHGNWGTVVRELNLRSGVLTRTVHWEPDNDTEISLVFERFLSMDNPHIGAIRMQLEVIRGCADIRVRGGLDAHVDNLGFRHLNILEQTNDGDTLTLLAQTRSTGIQVAAAASVKLDVSSGNNATASPELEKPNECVAPNTLRYCDADGQPALLGETTLSSGQQLTLTKTVALVSQETATDPLSLAQSSLNVTDWNELVYANRVVWDEIWSTSDVYLVGAPNAQLAVRFNIFQLLIAAPKIADASIGAKTLSGYGYRHHVFWDTETFMLPLFTHTQPALARRMLEYRWRRLSGARHKARAAGRKGAQFPWESAATGTEVTPTWVEHYANPSQLVRIWTGDIELHINADIAHACLQYWKASADDAFMLDMGAEIILDTANFWTATAQLEADGYYHLRDVIGPDEYHEHVDDNAFTNAIVAWHLQLATKTLAWLSSHSLKRAEQLRHDLGIDAEQEALWEVVSRNLAPPRESESVLEQFYGYFDLTPVDIELARCANRTQSMQQIYGIAETNGTQNLKQPDVLMLAYLLPEIFTAEQLQANYRYYDPRTDHEFGSSLGPAISAIVACRAGKPEHAYEHFFRAARADLFDVRHNVGDGIHGASAGGLWQAVVFGFAGLDVSGNNWRITPQLPAGWELISFAFRHAGVLHRVSVNPAGFTVS
ncbi:MAG: beta-phosphoglucomutase [Propionibacteriaceae bacterium]|jgi:kojibiose phosphorylase|nr:beta-phosphoglucomutase [Propionibacteriaceae bacterium]